MARNRILQVRSEAPFDSLDAAILLCIEHHVGRPCPTRAEIMLWTGMQRRRVWPYLEGMVKRGKIELEVMEFNPGGKDPKRRRMRKPGGEWTGWTDRPGRPCVPNAAVEATR